MTDEQKRTKRIEERRARRAEIFGGTAMHNASDFGFSISGQLPAASDEFDAHNATCTRCGMLALRDPWHHAERYQHNPTFRKDGKLYEFIPAEGRSREIRE